MNISSGLKNVASRLCLQSKKRNLVPLFISVWMIDFEIVKEKILLNSKKSELIQFPPLRRTTDIKVIEVLWEYLKSCQLRM